MVNYHGIKNENETNKKFRNAHIIANCFATVVLNHPNVFSSLRCLKSLNNVETPKDFCLLTKENKENSKKKSLDLLLHERRFFLLYSQMLLSTIFITGDFCIIFATS